MTPESILLTQRQAVAAVCRDLRQYAPQELLLCEILRVLADSDAAVRKEVGRSGAWVRVSGQKRMRWLDPLQLVGHACDTLTAAELSPDRLAAICGRVFQTRARAQRDPQTGETGIRIDTGMEGFACRQCGRCCQTLDYHQEVSEEDVRRWQAAGRTDILAWVGRTRRADGRCRYRVWTTPGTQRLAATCPFLTRVPRENRWVCAIHRAKPVICRNYPVSRKHAHMTGCPGFDPL